MGIVRTDPWRRSLVDPVSSSSNADASNSVVLQRIRTSGEKFQFRTRHSLRSSVGADHAWNTSQIGPTAEDSESSGAQKVILYRS